MGRFLLFIIIPMICGSARTLAGDVEKYFHAYDLYNMCRTEEDEYNVESLGHGISCVSYISGVIAGYIVSSEFIPQRSKICFPKRGFNAGKGKKIFLEWFKNNPKHSGAPAGFATLVSLKETYPCK